MRNIERDVRDTIESMVAPLAPRASVTFKDLDHGRTRAVIAVGAKQKAIIFRGTAPKGVTSALKRIEIDTRQALRELGAIDCPRASGIPEVPGMPKPNIEHHRLVKAVFGSPAKSPPPEAMPPSNKETDAVHPNTQGLSLVKPGPAPEREKRAQLTHDQILDIALMLQQSGKVEVLGDGAEVYVYATGWSDDRIREKIGVAATRVNEKIAAIRKKRFGLTPDEHERAQRRAEGGTAAEIAELRADNADLRARIEKLEAFARQFE